VQVGEAARQIAFAKTLERRSVQELRPENSARHLNDLVPAHAGRDGRAYYAARAGARDESRSQARFGQYFQHTNVRQAANRAPAQSQTHTCAVQVPQIGDQISLYICQ
jgi:hypothetical protein